MRSSSLLFLATLVATSAVAALPKEIDLAKHGKVTFLAVGNPSALKIRGELKEHNGKPGLDGKLVVKDNKLTGTATCQLDGFDTGIGLRNEHMKEKYLQTPKFPTAKVEIEPVTLPAEVAKGESATFPFKGNLTLHGETKPIEGTIVAKGSDLTFEFPLTLANHGVETPNYLGIRVDKSITVTVEAAGSAVPMP